MEFLLGDEYEELYICHDCDMVAIVNIEIFEETKYYKRCEE